MIFALAAFRAAWDDPPPLLRQLWRGARALGLHPFGTDPMVLCDYQLRWAEIQAMEDAGEGPRKQRRESERNSLNAQALELVIWADKHFTRGAPK